ncbi:hypothetical protein F5888DRAFT_1602282 [Russula emetica]|nr:hypothetical protein F5888DRAFT_1602282 [Russula emetica]
MSESIARVYTNTSRRANRKQPADHKVVYRSVLGNPFHVDWPVISSGLQQSILTELTALFDGVAAHYQLIRGARKKKGVAAIAASPSLEKTENAVMVSEPNQELHRLSTTAPPIIPHITVGINEVTKALEREIQSSRRTVITPSTAVDEMHSLIKAVFICYADLDTPAFVAHLPQLVALCNSARSEHHKIKVVQLPAGAQIPLADALGYLKRVSVIALDDLAPGLGQLEPLLTAVPDPPASWMASMRGISLEPSHIKQLLTTAPKDMKAAKERRTKGRAAAKERKKTKSRSLHGNAGT